MELTSENSMLKSPERKLDTPLFNPSLQNIYSPIPVLYQDNNLAEHQGSEISDPTFLSPKWSKTGRRSILLNHSSSFFNNPSNDDLPLTNIKKRKPDSPTSSNTKKIMVSSLDTNVSNQYLCTICGKSFKKYQALGGHTVHHNRSARLTKQHGTQRFVHECEFCNKVFSTGQSLGGHKRHCRVPVRGNEAHGNGEIKRERNQNRGLMFDLNELPK